MSKSFFLALILGLSAQAQTTLYQNNFTSGGAGWTLQQGNAFNTWIVNNVYTCVDNTPNQGGGNYMHVYDDLSGDFCAVYVILGSGSGETVYAIMNSGFSTVGQPVVTIQYDWLCMGQTGPLLASFGFVEYSIDGGNSWTTITNPLWKHNGQANWTTATISSAQNPGLLNQSDLRLRFGFTSSGYGLNPSFAVDNILITGSLSTSVSEINAIPEPKVFPNPSSGEFSLDLSELSGAFTVEIVDALGKRVFGENVMAGGIVPVHLNDVAPGLYSVRLGNESASSYRHILIH